MRFREMKEEYKSAKTEAEKDFVVKQYSESLFNKFLGCLSLLFLLLIFVAIITWIVAAIRFIF